MGSALLDPRTLQFSKQRVLSPPGALLVVLRRVEDKLRQSTYLPVFSSFLFQAFNQPWVILHTRSFFGRRNHYFLAMLVGRVIILGFIGTDLWCLDLEKHMRAFAHRDVSTVTSARQLYLLMGKMTDVSLGICRGTCI